MAAKKNQGPRDPKQQAALEALLQISILTEAAEKAGISRKFPFDPAGIGTTPAFPFDPSEIGM